MIKCKMKKQRGFIMIQVLLGLVVLIAIMTSWAYYQNRVHQKSVATRITNEVNYVLEAATSYYRSNSHWPKNMKDLIESGYLDPQNPGDTVMLNPYGQEYKIMSDSKSQNDLDNKLRLLTNIPKDDAYVSLNAMSALPFAKLNPKGVTPPPNYDTLQVKLLPHGSNGIIRRARVVRSGKSIPKPMCLSGEQPTIYTSVASTGDITGASVGGARTYATDDSDGGSWTVHMKVLTNTGWVEDKYSGLNRIEVITACQTPN